MGRNKDSDNVFFNNNYYNGNGKKNKNRRRNNDNYYQNNNQYYDNYNQYSQPYNNQNQNDQYYGQYSYSSNTYGSYYGNKNENSSGFNKLILFIGGGVLLLIILIVLIVLAVSGGGGGGGNNNDTPPKVVYKDDNQVVGDNTYGYVALPGGWIRFEDQSGPVENGYQFSDQTGSYIVTVSKLKTTLDNYKNNFLAYMSALKATNVNTNTYNLNNYNAYQIYGYCEAGGYWVLALFFMDGNGDLRFVGVEGPDIDNEAFQIPYTYKLTQ